MELRLIVSGTPKGECLWAPKEDYAYLGTLYTNSDVSRRYDIRLRNNGSGNYAFYHYLVYNTVSDHGGRSGGYLGITLRLDSYCPDYASIYAVLDMVYRKMIIGNIVKDAGDGRIQYSCASFEEKDSLFRQIEGSIKNMLTPVLTHADIIRINTIPHGDGMLTINMGDATARDVYEAMIKCGACSLSQEYPSHHIEKKLKENYERGRQSRQNEINILSQRLQDANEEIKRLETANEQKAQSREKTDYGPADMTQTTALRQPQKQQSESHAGARERVDLMMMTILTCSVISIILLLCILFCR